MRLLTAQQDRIRQLTTPDYAVYWRVQVGRSFDATEFVNLHDFLGYDLITSVNIAESIDNNVVTASISLTSRLGDVRLSPLVNGSVIATPPGGSPDPLFEPGNRVRIFAAVAVPGIDPPDSEYMQLFEGFLDKISTSPDSLQIECRDQSAPLLNDYVEEITRYGSDVGEPVEDIMQEIIDDHVPVARAPNLATPVSPNFNILTYAQRKEPVYSALRKLAQQIGWDIRFRANEFVSPSLPVLEDRFWVPLSFIPSIVNPPDANWVSPGFTPSGTNRLLLVSITSETLDSGSGDAFVAPVSAVTGDSITMTKLFSASYEDFFDRSIEHSVWYMQEADLSLTSGNVTVVVTVNQRADAIYGSMCSLTNVNQLAPFGNFGGSAGFGGLPRTVSNLVHESGDLIFAAGFDTPVMSSVNPNGLVRDSAGRNIGGNLAVISTDTATVNLDSAGSPENAIIAGVVKGIQGSGQQPTTFDLTFYEPERSKTTPDDMISPDLVLDHGGISVDNYTIRNKIRVVFVDATTQARTEIVVEDLPSQARYGIRFMEIVEGSTSNIDTLVEAQRMADAVLADLKEPTAKLSATLPFRPWIQIGDLLRFQANGEEWATDLDLAVQSYKHRVSSNGTVTTSVVVEGKPSSGWKRWFELEARPGIGDDANTVPPATPTGVTVQSELGGLRIEFDQPTDALYAGSEIHVGTVNDFTPSQDTLQGFARTNQFTVGGLTVGQTYYVKIIHVDTQGNRSAPTVQVITAAEFVGPRHRDAETTHYDSINENSNVSVFTKGLNTYPDFWGFSYPLAAPPFTLQSPPAWGNLVDDGWYFDTTNSNLGGRALRHNGATGQFIGSTMASDLAPIKARDLIGCEYVFSTDLTGTTFRPRVWFYDANRNLIPNPDNPNQSYHDVLISRGFLLLGAAPPANTRISGIFTLFAPDNASYVQIGMQPFKELSGNLDGNLFIDQIRLFPALIDLQVVSGGFFLNIQSVVANVYTRCALGNVPAPATDVLAVRSDNSDSFTLVGDEPQFTVQRDGLYNISILVSMPVPVGGTPSGIPSVRVVNVVNGETYVEGSGIDGEPNATASGLAFLEEGDVLSFDVRNTENRSFQYGGNSPFNWSITQVGEIR